MPTANQTLEEQSPPVTAQSHPTPPRLLGWKGVPQPQSCGDPSQRWLPCGERCRTDLWHWQDGRRGTGCLENALLRALLLLPLPRLTLSPYAEQLQAGNTQTCPTASHWCLHGTTELRVPHLQSSPTHVNNRSRTKPTAAQSR